MKKTFFYLFGVILMIFGACKHDLEKTQWDVDVLTPLLNTNLTIRDLLTDSLVKEEADSSLTLVYQNDIYEFQLNDDLQLPDTTLKKTVSIDSIQLGDQSITFSVTFGTLLRNAGTDPKSVHGVTFPFFPPINNVPGGEFPVDANDFFRTVTLNRGVIDIKVENQLSVDLTDIRFSVKNQMPPQAKIGEDTIPLVKKKGGVARDSIVVVNQTVDGNLLVNVENVSSPGSSTPVKIDTNERVIITITIRDLDIYEATAIFPAQNVVNDTAPLPFDLNGKQLSFAKVKSGRVVVEALSTVGDTLFFHYEIPSAYKAGTPFVVDRALPPAQPGDTAYIKKVFDFTGFTLNMKGRNNDTVNTLYNILVGRIDSTGRVVNISKEDSIYIRISLEDVVPEYAIGFMGKDTLRAGPDTINLELFNTIKGGSYNFKNAKLNVSVRNGIGVTAKGKVGTIVGINSKTGVGVQLTGTPINDSLTIAKPIDPYPSPMLPSPTINSLNLNESNSNITQLINNQPDRFYYDISMLLNSGVNTPVAPDTGTNFSHSGSGIIASLDVELPLNVITNNLKLADTIDFSIDQIKRNDRIPDGVLRIFVDNGFPFDAHLDLVMLDEHGMIIDSLFAAKQIQSAILDGNRRVKSKTRTELVIPYSDEVINQLNETRKIWVITSFTTPPPSEHTKIYSSYNIDIKMVGDFFYKMEAN